LRIAGLTCGFMLDAHQRLQKVINPPTAL